MNVKLMMVLSHVIMAENQQQFVHYFPDNDRDNRVLMFVVLDLFPIVVCRFEYRKGIVEEQIHVYRESFALNCLFSKQINLEESVFQIELNRESRIDRMKILIDDKFENFSNLNKSFWLRENLLILMQDFHHRN